MLEHSEHWAFKENTSLLAELTLVRRCAIAMFVFAPLGAEPGSVPVIAQHYTLGVAATISGEGKLNRFSLV